MGVKESSLAQVAHGRPSPADVISQRLVAVRGDYIALVADALIVRQRAVEWGLHRRQVWRYLKLVKARYARERTEADADFLRQLEGVVVANIQRARATEQRAADAGEFKAECAAQAQELRGVERLCAMRGLDAARKVEITKADPVAKMTADERRERALRALKRRSAQLVPMAATGEGETH